MEKCKCCGKELKNKRGLASHAREDKNPKCYKRFVGDLKKKKDRRPKITCEICKEVFTNITNTHLAKHNMTMQEYIEKFGKCFPEELLIEQRNKRERTLKTRYTKEELKYLKGEKSVKAKEEKSGMLYSEYTKKIAKEHPISEEKRKQGGIKIHIFYDDLKKNPKEYKKFNKKKLKKRVKTNIEKYGVPFVQTLDITKKKTLETCIKNNVYNKRRGRYRQTMKEKYGKYSNFFPKFSWLSQELFRMIEEKLNFEECYYATNKDDIKSNEYQVFYPGSEFVRYLDFYVPARNAWIEFDEGWHKNEECVKSDKKRENEIKGKMKNIRLLRITEKEYLKNKKKTLEKCLKFISKGRRKYEN